MDEATRERIKLAWSDVCARLAAGELVRDVLARYSVSEGDKRAYLRDTVGARQEWDEAREHSADAFMDEALACARSDLPNERSGHARTRIDALKWAARVRNPRVYSEKQSIDLNVRSVDLTAIIRDANARLAQARAPRLIEQVRDAAEGQARAMLPQGAESMLLTELL